MSHNKVLRWSGILLIALLAIWLGYPQPELNYEQEIVPLAREFASTDADADKPLLGLHVVITGATSGIGMGLTMKLSDLGATVIAMGRNPKKLANLKAQIPSIATVQAELSDLVSVAKAADEIKSRIGKVDVLINNAGIHYIAIENAGSKPITPQGIDLSFGTNYLSHFLLTEKLLPLLQESTHHGGTVLQVSSSFHWLVDGSELYWEASDEGKQGPVAALPGGSPSWLWGNQRAYCNSKLAQILHMRSLQQRYPSLRVKSICPCWVGTNIAGRFWSWILGHIAFPFDGYGIKSSLVAILDTRTSADYLTNSPITEAAVYMHDTWLFSKPVRDATVLCLISWLLALSQKFGAAVEARPSSPESYNQTLQESLYNWSYKTVQGYL